MEPLNLAGADTSGFEAIEPASYNAEIVRAEWDETSGNGKMPKGCPLLKVAFKVLDDGPAEGAWVWTQFALPNKEYKKAEKDKAAKSEGFLVRFLVAMGYEEEEVKSGEFDLSDPWEMLGGKEAVIRVSRDQWPPDSDPPEFQNRIKGVKPAGSPIGAGAGGSSGGII